MSVTIVAEGLDDFSDYLSRLPDVTTQAAVLAINQVAERSAVPLARAEIMEQVAFPNGYLTSDRLGVKSKANRNNLEAIVGARQRATSLARFVQGPAQPGKRSPGGVTVRVKPGSAKTFKSGFLVRLRSGKTLSDDAFNVGLAIRLRPGESLHGSIGATKLENNVYLLYGPSVDQVFKTVADDITPEVLDDLATEFLRQFVRLSGD